MSRHPKVSTAPMARLSVVGSHVVLRRLGRLRDHLIESLPVQTIQRFLG